MAPSLQRVSDSVCFSDMASAEQQKAGPQKDEDEEQNDDVAMETEEQEEELQAAEAESLKPDQLDTSNKIQKGSKTKYSQTCPHAMSTHTQRQFSC